MQTKPDARPRPVALDSFAIKTTRRFPLLLAFLAVALGGCQLLPGAESPPATPAATHTEVAVVPTFESTPAIPDVSPSESAVETPPVRNTPVVMETPVKTSRPRATPNDRTVGETALPTPKAARTPKPKATPVEPVDIDLAVETPAVDEEKPFDAVEPTPEAPPDVPVGGEVKVASLSFKPGSAASLVKIDATATAEQSIVKVELSAAARYKILPLPNRRQVWIDFEELELTEPKTIPGSGSSLVKEISARSFERGVVRVVVQLKDDGHSFPVIGPKKRAGESATVEVKIGPDPP